MSGKGAIFAVTTLVLGGAVDYLITGPFYRSLMVGTSFVGWNPLTVFLTLYGIPYAVSVTAVAAVIGAIAGAR